MADRPKPGAIVHVEFHVKEPKKVEKFYESLFGWKFQEVPGMNYSLFQAPSGPAGGIGGLQPGNWQPGVDRKSTRLNSSHRCSSYAVFCLKNKNQPADC